MRRLVAAFMVLALSLIAGGTPAAGEQPPGSGMFSQAGSLAGTRYHHTATLLPDGRVLVVGGMDADRTIGSAEVWDPVTDTCGPAGSLPEARSSHTATLLSDGRVLVVGGGGPCQVPGTLSCDSDGNGVLASAEVWDPATATFGPAGSLVRGRYNHTATPLPDGRVLVVGGWNGDDLFIATEVWSPLTPLPSADPATAVTAFLDAMVAKQWDTLPLRACSAQRDSVASFFGSTDATEQLLDMLQISIADRSVTLTETAGNTATVTIDGQLSWQVPDEALRSYFSQVNANADPSPAPSEIDQFVAQARSSFQALTLAAKVTVVNESGGWLACSDVVGSATASPSPAAS
jgi:hypothetical protein